MTERVEKSKTEQEQNSVDYAYGVIDAIVVAMDEVTAQPELADFFTVELLKKMPELIDALAIITKLEHAKMVGRLIEASSRMMASWAKTKMTK
jgi:hypothetical protein